MEEIVKENGKTGKGPSDLKGISSKPSLHPTTGNIDLHQVTK